MRRHLLLLTLAVLAVLSGSLPAEAAPAIQFPSSAQSQATAIAAAPLGEMPDRRTRVSKTERTAPGKYRTTVFNAAVNYRDVQGKWQPIDSTLIGTTENGYAWRNKANAFRVLLKKSLTPDYMRIDIGGKAFTQTLTGAASHPGSAASTRVSYPDAFSDVQVRYDVGRSGVEETLILASARAQTEYTFTLDPPAGAAVSARPEVDGGWGFYMAPFDQPVFRLAVPRAYDSGHGHAAQDPVSNASLKVTPDKGSFRIDLQLDPIWLRDPARVFPVFVDPTITIQPDTQDAYFHGNVPTDTGLAGGDASHLLHIGDSTSHFDWSALQFDMGAIPTGAQITAASLGLYYNGYCISPANACAGSTHAIEAHRMTAAWSPSSQTQQLAYDAAVLSSTSVTLDSPYRWINWNVTSTAQNWYTGAQPNYGLLLKRNPDVLGAGGPALPSAMYSDTTVVPKLDITYNSDGVWLNQPSTLHSNGADLSWSRYTGALSGAQFQKYEVHRSATKNFSPSSSTLLTTISDVAVTSYRDTTASPSKTFFYAVVANSSGSNQVQVSLPADGQATKVLQPGAEGQDTYNYYSPISVICSTYGASDHVSVGTDINRISRSLISFPLGDIPAGATIQSATLSLYHFETLPAADTIRAFRATRSWGEGTGTSSNGACTADGATWYEATGGVNWTTQGGDFANGANDQSPPISFAAGEAPKWHDFNITGLAQQWAQASAPNLGVLLKYDNEAIVGNNIIRYYASDTTVSSSVRPKLSITYTDNSHAIAPTVSISAPAPNATVMGTSVALTAGATDDRRVDKVEFYVDGALVGTSTTSPFSVTWNSTTVGNGAHTETAKAFDDASNVTTSSGVGFSVANFAAPTTAITSPTGGTVSGTVTVSATASAVGGLAQVEFFFDNTRFSTLTAAPFSASWNTLDQNFPAYDGSHALTTKAYDTYGQATTSAGVTVTVNNRGTTQYQATFGTPTMPLAMVYDPAGSATSKVTVTVTNTSTINWTNTLLYYRWFVADNLTTDVGSGGAIAMNLQKGKSSAPTTLTVSPPTLPAGVNSGQYQLRIDLYNSATAAWFAAKGNQPPQNPVIVNKALKTALGLERYYQYVAHDAGAGMQHLVNVANGDSILRWTPFNAPGRGLATVADFTYNSLEEHSESPAGNNMSLSISSLTRFGLPIDVHPNNSDTNTTNRWIGFTDGDGSYHKFQGNLDGSGNAYYVEPPGVHLYLRQYSTTDTTHWWAFTRPDRVTYFFNQAGYPTYVTDKNGNSLTFTLYQPPNYDNPGGPAFQITKVTDAGGRFFTINYFTKATAKKPQVRGKIASIIDHNGRELDFSYYEDGNLLSIVQKGGTNADGSFLPSRSFVFTYTTSSGAGPAIPNAADRVNPDPKTPNESTKLFSVRDPNGHETTFAYITSGQDKWKLSSMNDRAGVATNYAYNDATFTTTVTPPAPGGASRATSYVYDSDGKATAITNALQQITQIEWTADFTVSKVTEPNTSFTRYAYNNNGYLTDKYDQMSNHTALTYQNVAVDSADVAAHWCPTSGVMNGSPCAPRTTVAHISQLLTKTDPLGVANGSGYQWTFGYSPNGNLTTVRDPYQNQTTNAFNSDGTLLSVTDANQHQTQYTIYDANGLPTTVIDAAGKTATFGYDADGMILWTQDAAHAGYTGGDPQTYRSYFYYDSLNRLGRQSTPKSTRFAQGALIWSDTFYDANNNVIRQVAAHLGAQENGPTTTMAFDVLDHRTLITDPVGDRTAYAYDSAGRLTSVTLPKGVLTTNTANDFATFNTYDALDRVTSQTRYDVDGTGAITQTFVTVACFNASGDLSSTTTPNADLTAATINCASPTLANTTYYTYDPDHRVLTTKDADGHIQSVGYDADGNVTSKTDASSTTTLTSYDQMNRVVQIDQPFITGANPHTVTSKVNYDPAGNRHQMISARAYDASADKQNFTSYVTTYNYDAMNRLTRTDLPTDSSYPQAQYVHQAYDANGRLAWSALPDTNSDPNLVPSSKKTVVDYFDPGWIYTSQSPGNPRMHFDYTAEGRQSMRAPEDASGNLNISRQMKWTYFDDGNLSSRTDENGQGTTYIYDADDQMTSAHQASGITTGEQVPLDMLVAYDGLDRATKVRQQKSGDVNYGFTKMTYDRNSNITDRVENGVEDPNGGLVTPGKMKHFDYDPADWLMDVLDYGTTPTEKITDSFWPTGWEKQRVVTASDGVGGWIPKQTTNWDYYPNGKLNHMTTLNGSGATVESHTVSYVDTSNIYNNGNRTQDVFTQLGPDSSSPCRTTNCVATYQYDPRDRLVREDNGHGTVSTYTLDTAGNIQTEAQNGSTSKTYTYTGDQIRTITAGGTTSNYWYDPDGNLQCVTTSAGTQAHCPVAAGGTAAPTLLATYTYDYLERLASYRAFNNSSPTDSANYVYDALDRVASETETHPSQSTKTTTFTYLGLGNQVSQEQQSNSGGVITTKAYSYDAYGHRLTMTDTPNGGASTTYTYGYNVHDSVSLLLDPNGGARASYGYKSYGEEDSALSKGDTDKTNPYNAYRYEGKRFDSGSGSVDTGARRFAPDSAHFLTPDLYHGALADLGLGTDPLSQNRYSLAGGNPLSFIETDGHVVTADGGGGAAYSATPPPTTHAPVSSGSSQKKCDPWDLVCQAGQFGQGFKEGVSELWESGKALGGIAVSCVKGDQSGCGDKLEAMGTYIWNHPGDFAGSLIDWKDLSSGNYAKWAGHLAPSIAITVATVGGGGAIAKGAEAAGLAVRGAEAVTEAGGAAAEATGQAGAAVARAGVGAAAREASEAAGGAASNIERAAAAAGSGTGQSTAASLAENAAKTSESAVWRVWGGGARQLGRSWTPIDPRTLESARGSLGLPSENTGEFLTKAVIKDWTGIQARPSLPLAGNPGGALEYLIPDPARQLDMLSTVRVSPPF